VGDEMVSGQQNYGDDDDDDDDDDDEVNSSRHGNFEID
jgi:hypothetical protein